MWILLKLIKRECLVLKVDHRKYSNIKYLLGEKKVLRVIKNEYSKERHETIVDLGIETRFELVWNGILFSFGI